MVMDWVDSLWNQMIGRGFTDKLADQKWDLLSLRDTMQFNKDFEKNTGRKIKYPVVRGYDPGYNQYRLNRHIADVFYDNFSSVAKGVGQGTGWGSPTKTVRNIMSM